MPGGPYTLDTAYTDEDIAVVVTVEDNGQSIAAWALSFRVWRADGTEVTSGLSVGVTDADTREVTALVTGLTLAVGRYRWAIRRTDAGSRTVIAWGTLPLANERP